MHKREALETGLIYLTAGRVSADTAAEVCKDVRRQAARMLGLMCFTLQSGDDLREADVVALYLTERGNASLLPLLAASLKPSSRVVSYCWGMDGLPPTRASTCRGKDVVLTIGKPNVMLWEQSCIVRALRTPAG